MVPASIRLFSPRQTVFGIICPIGSSAVDLQAACKHQHYFCGAQVIRTNLKSRCDDPVERGKGELIFSIPWLTRCLTSPRRPNRSQECRLENFEISVDFPAPLFLSNNGVPSPMPKCKNPHCRSLSHWLHMNLPRAKTDHCAWSSIWLRPMSSLGRIDN